MSARLVEKKTAVLRQNLLVGCATGGENTHQPKFKKGGWGRFKGNNRGIGFASRLRAQHRRRRKQKSFAKLVRLRNAQRLGLYYYY